MPKPMLEDIDLIATDMDGTLLDVATKEVPSSTFPLIRELCDRGILFFAASGRQYPSLRRLFGPVVDEIGYVCENGALALHLGEVLFKKTFPRDIALDICHAVMERPDCNLAVSGERVTYVLDSDAAFAAHMENVVRNDVVMIARPEDIDEPIVKICFQLPSGERASAEAHFSDILPAGFHVAASGNTWLDIVQDGADKGSALHEVGKRLGIPVSRMMAFGDESNDAEMLDTVGHPMLMASGNPSLRGLNDRIRLCESVESELSRLLGR